MAQWYENRKRKVKPVNYSESKRRELRDSEIEFKTERIFTMQNTITRLNNFIGKIGTKDLTEDEISDTIEFLLAAGDNIRIHEDQTSNSHFGCSTRSK